jgi:pyridoxal phosphate enzyme (YggS family)
MHTDVQRLNTVKNHVKEILDRKQLKIGPQIIAVTKTFPTRKIIPLIEIGHLHFGENKIQEAESKWVDIKNKYKELQLHMLGKLQSNKVKKAVKLFDYIHSLDNAKIAKKIDQSQKELNKKIKIFIQVNLSKEGQKSGIMLNDISHFYNYCTQELSLNIIGLMCLPPINLDSSKFFQILKQTSEKLNLKDLSMGMSSDYEQAILCGSTYLRLGTIIFGERSI